MSALDGSARPPARSRRRASVAATSGTADSGSSDPGEASASIGAQLRAHRQAAGVSLRQFARDLGVSPSFVSQIENNKSQPSVATLYMICSQLNLSIDELFAKAGAAAEVPEPAGGTASTSGPGATADAADADGFHGALAKLNRSPVVRAAGPVITPGQRRRLILDSGVTWEQLSPTSEAAVDFLFVRYAVGGSSVARHELTRHSGVEYGYVISGTLEISLGFDTYRVGAGESISFDSSTPHRLTNVGDVPVEAIWFVHGRNTNHDH